MAGQNALLGSNKTFESGPRAIFCPILRLNRTKMFHVKHFGTIGSREHHALARRDDCLSDGIFCLVWYEALGATDPAGRNERRL